MNDIVRVGNLAEFTAEVTEGPIRLSRSERWTKNTIPTKSLELHLQGHNDLGELVWLMESHDVIWLNDGPETPRDLSICEAMDNLSHMIREHLANQGYEVRPGMYGIPDAIKPLRGHFEIVKWQKHTNETWIIVPLDNGKED